MIPKVFRICLGLLLAVSALALASPAGAVAAAVGAGSTATGEPFLTQPLASTTSPSGPADSGTGETQQSKETRVDYAPYVIGAIVVVALVAAFIFWRKRQISHPKKPD
ncbi:MAG: LuxR family transcriptional regulator [Arthrobacter sp.]